MQHFGARFFCLTFPAIQIFQYVRHAAVGVSDGTLSAGGGYKMNGLKYTDSQKATGVQKFTLNEIDEWSKSTLIQILAMQLDGLWIYEFRQAKLFHSKMILLLLPELLKWNRCTFWYIISPVFLKIFWAGCVSGHLVETVFQRISEENFKRFSSQCFNHCYAGFLGGVPVFCIKVFWALQKYLHQNFK